MSRIGYFDVRRQNAPIGLADEIEAAGHEAVPLAGLTPDSLSGIDVLYLNSTGWITPRTWKQGQAAAVRAAVFEDGLSLMYFDAEPQYVPRVLPGGGALEGVRYIPNGYQADLHPFAPEAFVTAGATPLTDDTFEGGFLQSAPGFVRQRSLPQDAVPLVTRATDSEIAVFTYGHGAGAVLYGTIPLAVFSLGRYGPSIDPITMEEASDIFAGSLAAVQAMAAGELTILRGTDATGETLDGTADPDRIWALDGADTLRGGEGADTLLGEDGDDRLEGGADGDRVMGGAGTDLLMGEDGDDALWADTSGSSAFGSDTLEGGTGDDSVTGANGAQVLRGDAGNDTLNGGDDWVTADQDRLFGGAGDDLLISGQDDAPTAARARFGDLMDGGDGADTLESGRADDRMTGGADADDFVFRAGFGADRITDLTLVDGDRIVLDGTGATGLADLRFGSADGDTIIELLATGDTITVVGQVFGAAEADFLIFV